MQNSKTIHYLLYSISSSILFVVICERFSEFYEILFTDFDYSLKILVEKEKVRVQLFKCFVEVCNVDRDTFDPIATHVVTRYTCSTFNVERTSRKANRASGRLRGN